MRARISCLVGTIPILVATLPLRADPAPAEQDEQAEEAALLRRVSPLWMTVDLGPYDGLTLRANLRAAMPRVEHLANPAGAATRLDVQLERIDGGQPVMGSRLRSYSVTLLLNYFAPDGSLEVFDRVHARAIGIDPDAAMAQRYTASCIGKSLERALLRYARECRAPGTQTNASCIQAPEMEAQGYPGAIFAPGTQPGRPTPRRSPWNW